MLHAQEFRVPASAFIGILKREWAEYLKEIMKDEPILFNHVNPAERAETMKDNYEHMILATGCVAKAKSLFDILETLEKMDGGSATYVQDIADALASQSVSYAVHMAMELNSAASPDSALEEEASNRRTPITFEELKDIAPVLLSRGDPLLSGEWGVEVQNKIAKMSLLKADSHFSKAVQALMEQHAKPTLDPLIDMFKDWQLPLQKWDPGSPEDLERACALESVKQVDPLIGKAATLSNEIGDETLHMHISLLSFCIRSLVSTAECYKLYQKIEVAESVNNLKVLRINTGHTAAIRFVCRSATSVSKCFATSDLKKCLNNALQHPSQTHARMYIGAQEDAGTRQRLREAREEPNLPVSHLL